MKKLFQEMAVCLQKKEDFVLVTVIAGSGSTPRGAGARMLIKKDGTFLGTIGGGNVEFTAQKMGLEVLKEKKSYSKGFKLARNQVADLGMICGGDVVVYFQYVSPENENFKEICREIPNFFSRDENSWMIT
ncbi:MAG: XdhC family protein, partial [Acetivibrio sp.]